jgi:hypothetical protein
MVSSLKTLLRNPKARFGRLLGKRYMQWMFAIQHQETTQCDKSITVFPALSTSHEGEGFAKCDRVQVQKVSPTLI